MTRTIWIGLLLSAAAWAQAPVLRAGIRVEMALTSSAAPMREADQAGAHIVAVARNGAVYLEAAPITPAALATELRAAGTGSVFVKADARVPFASVASVLEAIRSTGATSTRLLTSQRDPSDGRDAPPKGIEVAFGAPAATDKAVALSPTGSLLFGDVVRILDASRAVGAKVFLR